MRGMAPLKHTQPQPGVGVSGEDHPAETSLGISSPGCRHRGPPLTVDALAVLEGSIPFILQQDNQATPFSDAQRTNKPWEKIPWGRMAFLEGLLNCWAWVLYQRPKLSCRFALLSVGFQS